MNYQIIDNIPVWGEPLQNAVDQMKNCMKTAHRGALMADHHLGYAVPIGGVVAYRDAISPSGVGYDIACGNKAILTDATLSDVKPYISRIMDDIVKNISFGVGRNNNEPVEHELFDDPAWELPMANELKRKAASQLGTVGSGNHYVDIFHDERQRIWVGVHFGSRGFGHGIATYFIKAGGGIDAIHADPVLLGSQSELGQAYLHCMNLAGRYAYAGRDWVCQQVARIIGCNILEEVHNHHNFAWRETHEDEELWVVRKGATPAFPGQKGFIGGTMAEPAVIIRGVDSPESKMAMYSTIHGAGRVLSRRQAAGKKKWKRHPETGSRKTQLEPSGGLISREMMMEWVTRANVELRGAGVDESPHCYKRLSDVLQAHNNTITVDHILFPIGVAMAGANEYDPYKD